jgi:ABC-type multidrug transport system permease subunit
MNMATVATIKTFPREKAIVGAEMSGNLYRTLPYFAAKALSEIPLVGVFNSIFAAIIYPLTRLQKGRFMNFLGLTTLHTLTSEAAGLLISSISPNSDVALSLFPPLVVLNIIFDGRNISEENTPTLLRWIPKVGLVRWAFEGLALNEFTGLNFDPSGRKRGPVIKDGIDALASFGIEKRTLWDVVKAQRNIISACWILSYLGISLTKQKFEVMHSSL